MIAHGANVIQPLGMQYRNKPKVVLRELYKGDPVCSSVMDMLKESAAIR